LQEIFKFKSNFKPNIIFSDVFTPHSIERYTGHINGAVYGSPLKRKTGKTDFDNLIICGTDQGFLGIVGALLSGISMANLHGLSQKD
jgi:phytoene dehydrogenase-like protein